MLLGLATILLIFCLMGFMSTLAPARAGASEPADAPISRQTIVLSASAFSPELTILEREQLLAVANNTVLSSFTTADFSGPGICDNCHIGLKDRSGTDVSMPTHWRSTLMANSGKDPFFQAKVSSELKRMPSLKAVIDKKCLICHMPMGVTQALTDGTPIESVGTGFFNENHPLHDAAIDGTSYTLCHQVRDDNLGTKDSFSGGYLIDTSTSSPNRIIYGPYTRPTTQQMRMQSGFTPTYGAHIDVPERCATCHNYYTPYVDAAGNIVGEFAELTTNIEWENSKYKAENTSCQDCHMPLANGSVKISNIPRRLAAREPFFQHYFVGGNAFMVQIMNDWGAELEVTANPEHFSATKARTLDLVGNRTAGLTLESTTLVNNTLTANLMIAPLTGHKFPSGFPSRRTWLHVTVSDAAGRVIFESGKFNPDGTITGNAADFNAAAYEPHYNIITLPDQVQIYETIMKNSDGQVTYTLVRAAGFLKDNRLLPQGANKAQLPSDIAVYGQAAADANFVGGSDLVTYQVNVTGAQGPFTINAELLYDPLTYRFIQDMVSDRTSLTERFNGYYQQADKTPLRVAAIAPVIVKK
jgi:hypothetical protein